MSAPSTSSSLLARAVALLEQDFAGARFVGASKRGFEVAQCKAGAYGKRKSTIAHRGEEALGLAAFIAELATLPSTTEQLEASARQTLFFPGVEDMTSLERGVSRLNTESRERCAPSTPGSPPGVEAPSAPVGPIPDPAPPADKATPSTPHDPAPSTANSNVVL